MSTITTTGTPGTLLSTPDETFDDSMIASYGYFADHFEQVIYDILYGNGYAYSVSNTYLSAHLYGADGDVQVYGSGFYGSRSKISEIDFAGDGGTFVVKGSGSLNTARGTLTGSFTSIEAHHGSDGMLLEGRMNLDNNGYLVGTVTHQVAYSGSLTSEYFGKMSANSLNGTVTKVILHDNSGNSLTVTGKYTVAALQAVFDVTSTAEEVLNTASLFSGDDTFTVPDSAHAWHGFDGKDKLTGGALGDTLYGDEGNDTLYGLGGSDSLYGGNGDDILDGGTGADVMTGGAGNDKYFVDNSNDDIFENPGEGIDTVTTTVSFDLQAHGAHVEILVLAGTGNIDATGNDLANTITGNTGNNRIDGGMGADKMSGGTGNDTYVVDNIGDSITEKSGIDTIESSISYTLGKGLENLTLTGSDNIDGKGNTAANVMIGNSGQNTLNGDRGDDILDGGAGHDILTGGLGADRFVFSAATFDGVSDTITDFSVAQHDRLDIHDLLAGFDPLTSNLSDFVQVTNNGVDSFLIIDADGTGSGSSPVQVALLANVVLADETSLVASGNLIVS